MGFLIMLFMGFLRLMHLIASRFVTKNERLKRIVTALVFGLALPWGGLALNLHVPFPADFANPWPWVLSAVTTLAMIVETKPSRGGLALWFVKLCAGVLSDKPLFVLINSYTTGLAPSVLGYLLNILVASKYGGKCTWDELGLPVTETGLALPCGATGRWCAE